MTGEVTLASTSSAGTPSNGTFTYNLSFSSDGRFLAFDSQSGNLVSGDLNQKKDVFVKDLHTDSIEWL